MIRNFFGGKKMSTIDLSKYGVKETTEIIYNPSYETLFEEKNKLHVLSTLNLKIIKTKIWGLSIRKL